jgi:hypothetical protein
MRLRYEDFAADPKGELERIGSLIELDLTGVAAAASSGKPMQAGHNVGGNKTKKSGTITLRPDAQEWRTALSATEQRLSWAFDGMAYAPLWLQEVMSKDAVVSCAGVGHARDATGNPLMLEKLCTAKSRGLCTDAECEAIRYVR